METLETTAPTGPTVWRLWHFVAGAAVVFLLIFLAGGISGRSNSTDRNGAESDHSISLPDSASEIESVGDEVSALWKAVNLDRGVSSVLVIDRVDVPELLGEFRFDEFDGLVAGFSTGPSPAPGNSQYQPTSTPWDAGTTPERRECTDANPGSADFACVFLYPLDDAETVGVWIYSDWN